MTLRYIHTTLITYNLPFKLMNLLVTDERQFLPKHIRDLTDHKVKSKKYKKRIAILLSCSIVLAGLITMGGGLLSRATPYLAKPLNIKASDSAVFAEAYQPLTSNALATVVKADNIVNPAIYTAPSVGQLTIQPAVVEQSITSADSRVTELYRYLKGRNSPMAGSAATFIRVADQYHFNWTLLPGIALTESSLGQVIPLESNGTPSYNAFGYGVTGNGDFISFSSWDNAIESVASGLVKSYGASNMTPSFMEPSYCPPSANSDHHWEKSVAGVMSEL